MMINENNYADLDISALESVDQLSTDLCREAYAYWKAMASENKLGALDPIDVPSVIPFLAVIEVSDPEPAFTFRFAGQGIVAISDKDLTGKPCDEEAPITFGTCKDVVTTAAPVHANGRLVFKHPGRTYLFDETIGLPILDESGNVKRIWIAHGPVL